MKYVPFLKLKANEIRAIGDLTPTIKEHIIPFFDVILVKDMTFDSVSKNIISMKKIFNSIFTSDDKFYIDNYDHQGEDSQNYSQILDTFSDFNIIPVVGLDRDDDHIEAIKSFFSTTKNSKKLAIRLSLEDIKSFKIIKDDIEFFLGDLITLSEYIDLIIDIRVIKIDQVDYVGQRIIKFIQDFTNYYDCDNIIVTASSFPSIVREIIDPNDAKDIRRIECILWKKIIPNLSDLEIDIVFGDYTVVSPDYPEPTLSVELMSTVMAPKIFYTYQDYFYGIRGKTFKSHPLGYKQYFEIAKKIVAKPYYRGFRYSFGEKYIHDRAQVPIPARMGTGNPSSWIRATVNSHITFMTSQF